MHVSRLAPLSFARQILDVELCVAASIAHEVMCRAPLEKVGLAAMAAAVVAVVAAAVVAAAVVAAAVAAHAYALGPSAGTGLKMEIACASC